MPNMPNQKRRLLLLARIFHEKTDPEHGLTTQEIIEELAYHGADAERRSLYRDIQAIREAGCDIRQMNGRKWHLATRPLELEQMAMLIDAVQGSPFLTEEMAGEIAERVKGLASHHQKKLLDRRVVAPGKPKARNPETMRSLDAIQQAMREGAKLEFRYFHYDAKKDKVLNRGGKAYRVTPVRLVYADELYYLVAFMDEWADVEGHQPFTPYRVDRMLDAHAIPEPATRDRRIAGYRDEDELAPGFGVFASEKTAVTLEFDESAMNPVIDKFGIDSITFEAEGGRIRAHVRAPLSPQFYGWLLQLGTSVKVIRPRRAVDGYRSLLGAVLETYEDGEES